jgi:DnaJ-class molecular chaperone
MEAMHGETKHVSMANGKSLRVTIPPGTRHGQTLRLKDQGMGDVGGVKDGDARVEILVDNHNQFFSDGDNILIDSPVSLSEADLGGRVEAPTVDGPVSVTVPANANSGTVLPLRNTGVIKTGGTRGDQLPRLQVMLPDKCNP